MSARNPASHLAFARCSPRKAAGALRRESLHRKVVHGGHPALNKDAARTQHYFCARRAPCAEQRCCAYAARFLCTGASCAEQRCCAYMHCSAGTGTGTGTFMGPTNQGQDARGECGWSGVRVALDSCCRARPSRTEPRRVTKARETRAAPRACQGRASREWDRYSTVRA